MQEQRLHHSRIEDHNLFPSTDTLYDPLRRVLLRPDEVAVHRPLLNPAAAHSRVTRDFAFINEPVAQRIRESTLIPVDRPLVPTYDLDKVRNNRFMVVDAQELAVGQPISEQQMHRIRTRGLKEERVVYDFGAKKEVVIDQVQPVVVETKVVKEKVGGAYKLGNINYTEYDYSKRNKSRYKYNLYSIMDELANGEGCGCADNEFIASRNQPQSLNWLN